MNLIKQESLKLFIKRWFLLMVAVLLIFDTAVTYVNITAASPMSTQSLYVYKEYINRFQGDLTDEKIEAVEKIKEEAEQIFEQKQVLDENYKNAVISLDEYESRRIVLNENQSKLEGVNAFLEVYNSAMLNDLQVMDATVWTVLLSDDSIDIFAVTLVILLVILLCVYDRENGMDYIKSATPNGKKRLWLTQAFIIVSLSFFIGVIISVLKYSVADICYGLSGHSFKIQNIDGFESSTKNLTVFSLYIVESLLKTFGLIYLALFTYTIGILVNSSLYTVFFSFVIVYLPAYTFEKKQLLYLLPFPSALMTPSGWFKSFSDDAAFNEITVPQIVVYIAVIFMLLLMFGFLSNAVRKRRNIT